MNWHFLKKGIPWEQRYARPFPNHEAENQTCFPRPAFRSIWFETPNILHLQFLRLYILSDKVYFLTVMAFPDFIGLFGIGEHEPKAKILWLKYSCNGILNSPGAASS